MKSLAIRNKKDDILRKIKELGEGAIFTPKDLLDVASRGMVDMTLKQLGEAGTVRKLARGLYDYPKFSTVLQTWLTPDVDLVAQAMARRFRWHIVPSGAHAANLLGLSSQVPAKAMYLSDGPSKTIKLGSRDLTFKHARPKDLGGDAEPAAAAAIQALRHLGRESIDGGTVNVLRARLSKRERESLLTATRYGSEWIYAVAKQIAGEGVRS
jgi:hypothetical protein